MTTAVWWTPDCGYLHLEYDPRVISVACPDGVSHGLCSGCAWRTTEPQPDDDTDVPEVPTDPVDDDGSTPEEEEEPA